MEPKNPTTIFDDLEDATFAAPRIDTNDRAEQVTEAVTAAATLMHWNKCPKCYGTGQTRWGKCFACKGAGGKNMKTTFAQRQASKMQAADRADRKREEQRAAFAAEYPAEHKWILSRIDWELRESDRGDFGRSLLAGIDKFGGLTDRQLAAVRTKLAAAAERAEQKKAAPVLDVSGLDAAFAVARDKGAKIAVLRTSTVIFSLAKATGKNPGAIYAKSPAGEYLGKIAGGRFVKAFACKPADEAAVIEASRDPKGAALRFAAETGRCSICNAELTDPVSVKNGIGPICAQKFGW